MVIHACRWFVALLCLTCSVQVSALGIFWQPQERDLAVDNQAWTILMQQVKQQGFEQLVLQWSRYGTSFSSAEQMDALQDKMLIAADQGLQLVLGLYMDPEFYALQKQPAHALESYLRKQRSLNIQVAKQWQERLGELITGWYISAEIDDENWRLAINQEILRSWLQELATELQKVQARPVYLSTFFTGKMSPVAYEHLLVQVADIGYRIWVQDGSGVGVLSESHRRLYLDQVVRCTATSEQPVTGVIYELFDMTSEAPFVAQPKSRATIEGLINQKDDCQAQRLFFSLRYLPASQMLLQIE